jgi:ribosome modulation factor
MNDTHAATHCISDDKHGYNAERQSDEARQSLPANQRASAADRLGPGLVLATQDQGYAAAWNGDHVDTCPWLTATTERDLALRQMWIRGYSAGRTDLCIARAPLPK